jgi:RNA polymerase sigma-70 factor (ECF subfamily)
LPGVHGRAPARATSWILRRLVLDRQRAARRQRGQVSLDEVEPATDHGALDLMLADEAEARLGRAVQGLTRMQREVFTLRVAEGASYREIAGVLGTTEGAARVHYHNAVRAVKEALDD